MGQILHGSFRFPPYVARVFVVAAFALFLYQILLAARQFVDLLQVSHRYAREEQQLEERWQTVRRDLERARDARGVLRVARRDLVMARPGEVPVVFQEGVRGHVMDVPSAAATPRANAGKD